MKENQSLRAFITLVIALGTFIGISPSIAVAEESPNYGHFSISVGTYYPSIDKEFAKQNPPKTPFRDFFGSNRLWIFEGEVGINVWQGFGKLGFSGHFAYTSAEAEAQGSISQPPAAGGNGNTAKALAKDTTSLTLYPLYLSAFYSFDALADLYNIPFALNVDAGLVYIPWVIDGTDGSTASYNGKKGRGGTWGWRTGVELAFLLNILDENSAALFDMSWGVNRSWLFVEFVYQKANDFGRKKSFDLSDMYFQGGLRLSF